MTTDNRTNEPTEAQARAIRKLDNVQAILAGAQASVTDAVRELSLVSAALVAAQGAAPQAEIVPKPSARVATRSFDSDCAHGTCPSGCSHLMWICDTCSCEGGWGATRDKLKKWAAEHVCPVLPSSGVDEDDCWHEANCRCIRAGIVDEGALAEVIGKARTTSVRDDDGVKSVVMESNEQIARAVAAWLKGQGGESRGEAEA